MTATGTLTAEDLQLLGRPLHGFLTVAGGRSRRSPDRSARYWGPGDPARADDLAAMLAADLVRVVLHPEAVHRYPA